MTSVLDLIEPINWQAFKDVPGRGNWLEMLQKQAKIPLEQADLAVITLLDSPKSALTFRQKLYSHKKGSANQRIIDLGEWPAKHREKLSELCAALLTKGIVPLVLAAQTTAACAHLAAHYQFQKALNVLMVLPTVEWDLGATYTSPTLLWLKEQHFSNIEHLSVLGYKEYESERAALSYLLRLGYDTLSIGRMRDLGAHLEPIVRTAQAAIFELDTIKIPSNKRAYQSIFGLNPEEAVRLAWYAGNSEQMQSMGLYGLQQTMTWQQAELCATMIWYFAEGFYHRQQASAENCLKYYVPVHEFGQNMLVFYKNKSAPVWWIELPQTLYRPAKLLPCSAHDYQEALKGEVPERWLRFLQKR